MVKARKINIFNNKNTNKIMSRGTPTQKRIVVFFLLVAMTALISVTLVYVFGGAYCEAIGGV